MNFLRSAMALAGIGLKVFPIWPKSRMPAIKQWPELATDDPDEIDKWHRWLPDANVAIHCGEASGIIVIDVDTKAGRDGRVDLATHARYGRVLPPCPEVRTPSGGLHLFFAYRAGLKNSVGMTQDGRGLGAAIDIRTNRGFVLAAPSETEKGTYRWTAPPVTGKFPPLPSWAYQALMPQPKPTPRALTRQTEADPSSSLGGLVRFVSSSQEGSRNSSLYWAAMRAQEKQLPGAFSELYSAAVNAGLDPNEVKATLNSAKLREVV